MKSTILFLLFSYAAFGQSLFGSYSVRSTKAHSSITLKKDSSYVQFNADCTYLLKTVGNWKINRDTIIVFPTLVFARHPDGRKDTPIIDTSDGNYKLALRMTKYIIQSDTSLILLKNFNDKYVQWRTLTKQKSKRH